MISGRTVLHMSKSIRDRSAVRVDKAGVRRVVLGSTPCAVGMGVPAGERIGQEMLWELYAMVLDGSVSVRAPHWVRAGGKTVLERWQLIQLYLAFLVIGDYRHGI